MFSHYEARNYITGGWMANNSDIRKLVAHIKAKAPVGKMVAIYSVSKDGKEVLAQRLTVPTPKAPIAGKNDAPKPSIRDNKPLYTLNI